MVLFRENSRIRYEYVQLLRKGTTDKYSVYSVIVNMEIT